MQNQHNGLAILFSGKANLHKGIEGVGGRLLLTQKNLFFKPHAINIQKDEETIYLKDIRGLEKVNFLGIIPNGLKVITDKREYKFVLMKRKRWIREITKLL